MNQFATHHSAEFVERSTLAERNAAYLAGVETQSSTEAVDGLNRIRAAAKRDPNLKFNNLYHHLTRQILYDAYLALKKKAAPGVDKISWRDYGVDLDARLDHLHDRICRQAYKPQPSLRVWISKDDGSQRPIGIAATEDKIVQQALVWILQEIYEEDFIGFSYGFRLGRGQHHALDSLFMAITTKKVSWVLDADIKGFFNNLVLAGWRGLFSIE